MISYRENEDFSPDLYNEVKGIINDENKGLDLICAMLAKAVDDEEIAYIAAGPLEKFIQIHAERIKESLAECVCSSVVMRRAIAATLRIYYKTKNLAHESTF